MSRNLIEIARQVLRSIECTKTVPRDFHPRLWRGFILLLISLCHLVIASSSLAQTGKSSWGNLSSLQPGWRIQVVEANSKHDSGLFVSITEDAVTLQEKHGEKIIQRRDVHIVRLMKNKHRLRNTLVGAGVGAGLGAGLGAATGGPCRVPPGCFFYLTRGQQAALFAAPGIVIGAAVGALWPTHEIVYRTDGSGP
jgi:hypothetical protein